MTYLVSLSAQRPAMLQSLKARLAGHDALASLAQSGKDSKSKGKLPSYLAEVSSVQATHLNSDSNWDTDMEDHDVDSTKKLVDFYYHEHVH